MKYNKLKEYMDMTEDFATKYRTKHGKEISKDELGNAKDSYTEIELTGHDSATMTKLIEIVRVNAQIEKEAKALKIAAQVDIENEIVAKKYFDALELAESIAIKTQTFERAVRTKKVPAEMKYDIKMHIASIYEKLPQYAAVFDDLKKDAQSEQGGRKSSIKAASIKNEGVSEYARKIWLYLKKLFPVMKEMENLVDDALSAFKEAGSELRTGMDDMIEDPDYYRNRE